MGTCWSQGHNANGGSGALPTIFAEKAMDPEATKPPERVIEFLTDVEGHWDYFVHFVHYSKVLNWEGETRGVWGPGKLRLEPNGMLVFGGDAFDKGPGDIRFAKTLLELKQEYPSQVIIILGNRDLLKLRLFAELQEGQELEEHAWHAPWEKQPVTPFKQYLEQHHLERTLASKLKWIFQCNGTGCQDTTFKTRKEELALINGQVKEQDVVDSYVHSVDPLRKDAWALELIKVGQIAAVVDDALFVHGGLQDESAGFVPGRADKFTKVQEWVDALNAWKDLQVKDYLAQPSWIIHEDGQRTRGGQNLMQYGTPCAGKGTVIYYNPFEDGNPVQRTPAVRKFLADSGIRRMFSGHQPHGQTPTVVRHLDTGLLVVTADTSRSDAKGSKLFNPANNRGSVVSVVRLEGPYVYIEGELSDGTWHNCRLHTDPQQDKLPDALVGRQLANRSWVKTVVHKPAGEPAVIAALGKGFNVLVEEMPIKRACLKLSPEYTGNTEGWVGAFDVRLEDMNSEWFQDATQTLEDCKADDGDGPSRSFTFNRALFDEADTYICALSGVLNGASRDAVEAIKNKINMLLQEGKRVVFCSNDSRMSRAEMYDKITKDVGIRLEISQYLQRTQTRMLSEGRRKSIVEETIRRQSVVTSANTCAWFLKKAGIKKPFVICSSKGLLTELRDVGITDYVATIDENAKRKPEFQRPVSMENVLAIVGKDPDVDAVVVGWDQELTALVVAVAAQYIRCREELREKRGSDKPPLPLVTCSMDVNGILGFVPKDFAVKEIRDCKVFSVGTGTMAKAVRSTLGATNVEPIPVGKPSLLLLEHLRRPAEEGGLGIDLKKAVVIGDKMDTDIGLAYRGGMRSLLVMNGVTDWPDLEAQTDPALLPTWAVNSLADI